MVKKVTANSYTFYLNRIRLFDANVELKFRVIPNSILNNPTSINYQNGNKFSNQAVYYSFSREKFIIKV
jgi:hypothetical protein